MVGLLPDGFRRISSQTESFVESQNNVIHMQRTFPTSKTELSGQGITGLSANLPQDSSSTQLGKQGHTSSNNVLEAAQPMINRSVVSGVLSFSFYI